MRSKNSIIELCSKCTVSEIAGWVFENQLKLEPETISEIREELKDIKLKEGICIACGHNLVAESSFDRVLNILKKSKSSPELIEDFEKFSGFLIIA